VDPIGPWPCKGQPDPWCCPQQVSYAKILQHKVHKKKSALLKYADICQDRLQTSARKHWSKRWCFSQAEASSGQWQFDAGSVTAYFDASNASGGRIQYWYDDPATLSVKATWMKSAGVRGVAMWTAGSVNYTAHEGRDAAEMWGALRLVL
jgi:spore germination protein YaaH